VQHSKKAMNVSGRPALVFTLVVIIDKCTSKPTTKSLELSPEREVQRFAGTR